MRFRTGSTSARLCEWKVLAVSSFQFSWMASMFSCHWLSVLCNRLLQPVRSFRHRVSIFAGLFASGELHSFVDSNVPLAYIGRGEHAAAYGLDRIQFKTKRVTGVEKFGMQ